MADKPKLDLDALTQRSVGDTELISTVVEKALTHQLEIEKTVLAMALQIQEQFHNPLLEAIQRAADQFKPILDIQKQVQVFLRPLEAIQRFYNAHMEQLAQLGKIAAEAMHEMDKFHGALVEVHSKEKLFLSPFFYEPDISRNQGTI